MNRTWIRSFAVIVLIGLSVPSLYAHQQQLLSFENHVVDDINMVQLRNDIELNLTDTSLEEALIDIAEKADLNLMYSKVLLPDKRITLREESISLYDALWAVLDGSDMRYAISQNRQLVLLKDEEVEMPMEKEIIQETISGTVTDAQTGEVLPGVNIVISGTTTGASTNNEGSYVLDVPADSDSLTFSYLGYINQSMPIEGRNNIDVSLEPDLQLMEEVVVVGYGTQTRTSMTSSVSEISSRDVQRMPVSNTSQALQGIAPGVTVLDEGGAPGRTDATIRIRGTTSIGGNDPLIIVDGIEQPIRNVNPDNIESISVLKDASSTAIYGSRAANGVVLITTKRAEEGAIQVSYKGYYGMAESINRPQHMGVEDYMQLQNTAYINDGRSPIYTESEIQNYVNATDREQYPLPNTWWDDDSPILRSAPQMQNTITISGGTEDARGLLSVRYKEEDGVLPNYNSNIGEIRLNTDFNVSSKISVNADLNYNNSNSQRPIMNIPQYMLHATQWVVPRYSDGTYGLSPQGHNPLTFTDLHGINEFSSEYLVGNVKADLELMKGLNFSTQFARRSTNDRTRQFNNAYEIRDFYDQTEILKSVGPNSLSDTRRFNIEHTFNNTLMYSGSWENHSTDALLGYSEVYNETQSLGGERDDFYNNLVGSMNMGDRATVNNSGSETEWGLRSFFGRLNYSYQEKYLMEVNARMDGSSRFSRENRYSFFPSFSLAWRISEEPFWNLNNINEFKIRGSFGETGNQAVSLYQYYDTFNTVNYPFNNNLNQGFRQNNLANEDLTWETTTQLDVGIDATLFNNKLDFTVDYYRKRTDGILLRLPIPTVVGLNAPFQNAGVVDNKGWEASLGYRNMEGALQYRFAINVSDNINEVIDLKGTGPYIDGSVLDPMFVTEQGLPLNAHWGYTTDGLFQNEQEIQEASATLRTNSKPGDVRYVDLNDDGRITSDDMTMIGDEFPRYTFGLTSDFSFKNFDANIQIQGVGKQDRRLAGALHEGGAQEGFAHDIFKDYWTEDNPDARFPRPVKGDLLNYNNSDRTIVDGSYVRLKNLQVGYNIDGQILNNLNLKSARVYVNMTNLFTISNLNEWGLDPEVPSGRASYYPQVGMYSLGVNIDL